MSIRWAAAVGLLLALAAGAAYADGKVYWHDVFPPEIPHQRAVIIYEDGVETLIVQTKYRLPGAEGAESLGWVLPTPAVPEVASMSAEHASDLFSFFYRTPDVVHVREVLLLAFWLALGGLSIAMLLLFILSWLVRLPKWLAPERQRLFVLFVFSFLLFLICAVQLGALGGKVAGGVEVIEEKQVGIYDVRVVRAGDAQELIAWLNERKFAFAEEDKAAFEAYIKKGWCFVAARVGAGGGEADSEVVDEGMLAPLVCRFRTDPPVYPLALTSTAGSDTELVIYFGCDRKMACGERLKLDSAWQIHFEFGSQQIRENVEPKGFFDEADLDFAHLYVTKFKGTLSPEQMREDIAFAPATDNEPFEERVVRW